MSFFRFQGVSCKGGAVFDDCAPACQRTCDNKDDVSVPCPSRSCVAGCRCPAGTVWNSQKTKCIQSWKCPVQVRGEKSELFRFSCLKNRNGINRNVHHGEHIMLRAFSFDILKSFSVYPLLVESRFSGALVLKLPLHNLCHENTDYFESRIFRTFISILICDLFWWILTKFLGHWPCSN